MPPTISISELYSIKNNKDKVKFVSFDLIIEKCHLKIKNTALNGGMNIFFEVPFFLLGKPLYKINECIDYIISALKNNGLFVQLLPPPNNNILYISWKPTDIKIKKKLQLSEF